MSNYNSVPGGQGENICIPDVRKLCKPNEGWIYLLWAIGTNSIYSRGLIAEGREALGYNSYAVFSYIEGLFDAGVITLKSLRGACTVQPPQEARND